MLLKILLSSDSAEQAVVRSRLERLRNVVEKASQVSDDKIKETDGELSMPALTRGFDSLERIGSTLTKAVTLEVVL